MEATNGGLKRRERLGGQAIAGFRPLDLALNQSGGLEFLKVLAYRGLRQTSNVHKLAANTCLFFGDCADYGQACGVA